jgi:two-component sensor histidine kinase
MIRIALNALPTHQIIEVLVSPSSLKVPPKQATHLALIINELTTNTVKHAMEQRARGQITVNINHEKEDLILKYQDDGPGYPEAVLHQAHYDVGLSLVQQLVRSLPGTLTLANDGGAVAILRFVSHEDEGHGSEM